MAGKFKSLGGQLLLDGGDLGGSFFHRTVVLICQHDADGAFGLVLNRPSEAKVGEALLANLPAKLKGLPLHLGGPVQPEALSFLHSDGFMMNANILPNLNLGHSLEQLVEIGESYSSNHKLRIFAGYSGWSPGQLESELKRDAWVVHPATLELIFGEDNESLWRHILRQRGLPYRLLADAPDDLASN